MCVRVIRMCIHVRVCVCMCVCTCVGVVHTYVASALLRSHYK